MNKNEDESAEVQQLKGVWSVVHYTEYSDDVYYRGTYDLCRPSNVSLEQWQNSPMWIEYADIKPLDRQPQADFDVVPRNEQYCSLMFRGQTVTVIATGDPESVDVLNVTLPYAFKDAAG